MRCVVVAVGLLAAAEAAAEAKVQKYGESPKNMAAELRVGAYTPFIDRGLAVGSSGTAPFAYARTFGGSSMLLGELEIDRQFFTAFGSIALAATVGYTEKYGRALDATGAATPEVTALQLLPMKASVVYRFDWLNLRYHIPLVPYVKGGFALTHWWMSKGGKTEVVNGVPGLGWSYGLVASGGLMFLLDVLDPRLARDFDTGVGVNHTYIFGEFNFAEINNFGRTTSSGHLAALDLSARYWMFGLAFEY